MEQHLTSEARTTLTFASAALAEAQSLADRIEEHAAIDALAVTINETDEERNLWKVVAYFPDDAAAAAARAVIGLPADDCGRA